MANQIISFMLVDSDAIFRLGLDTALTNYSDFRVINQADNLEMALAILSDNEPDLIIAEWQFCEPLLKNNSDLNIFLLTSLSPGEKTFYLKQLGVKGYAKKGIAIAELVSILNRVARGESYWSNISLQDNSPSSNLIPPARWLSQVRYYGLEQIEHNLVTIESNLQKQLSDFDRLFWQGRQRELKAARWVVKQLIPFEIVVTNHQKIKQNLEISQPSQIIPVSSSLPLPTPPQSLYVTQILENTIHKLQFNLDNLTNIPLETDLLKPEKKRELFYLVLDRFYKTIDELRFLKVTPEEIEEKQLQLLKSLWQESSLIFWKKILPRLELLELNFNNLILEETLIIEEELLSKIPYFLELVNYILLEKPLIIDNVEYRADALEAIERAGILLENLIISISNGVVQIILNNFYNREDIKSELYHKRLISSRAIASFRNNLSWKYRKEKYFEQPQLIFESKHRLFYFNGKGIDQIMIYAPRQEELKQLQGIAWWVTIGLELKDAIAPRFRAIIAFLGEAVVYILTQIIGRGLGLIGKGILQGVGNSLPK